MPCHTRYDGLAEALVLPFRRTEITIDQVMSDEYGDIHGTILTANDRFGQLSDYLILADLLNLDGQSVLMSQSFLYLEEEGDAALCEANGWTGVEPVDGLTPAEAMVDAAQTWLTENYQEYVHTHESPQDVFIIGTN